MLTDIFTTSKYDNNIIVKHHSKDYTVKEIKEYITGKMQELKTLSENVVIMPDDNFHFIINFFASIFTNKNIYLITENQKLNTFNVEYSLLNNDFQKSADINFPDINISKPCINFYTSGSIGKPKCIKKSLYNLIKEGQDATETLKLNSKNLIIKSTTTMCHLFGMTFSLIFPLCNGYIIDTDKVLYPEDLKSGNSFLVSTPTFLNSLYKHSLNFIKNPEFIISSGAKLENDVFKYFEEKSSVIEIYGSTETGIVAYRQHFADKLTVFPNVEIENNDTIKSDYIYEGKIQTEDVLELSSDKKLSVIKRKDKIIKIYEKRISSEVIENALNQTIYIDKSYCFKHKDKLVCICSLKDKGKKIILDEGIVKFEKILKTELKKVSEIVPQRWRFVDELPYLQTGKINRSFLEHLFEVNVSYPIILEREKSLNKIIYKLFFHKNCNFYKGHFPDFPITPGVVQLYLADELAKLHFSDAKLGKSMKKIKFSNIIFPNSIVNLEIVRSEKNITFVYNNNDDDKIYSSGVFPIENINFKGVENNGII